MGKSCSFDQPYFLFVMSICSFGCFPFGFESGTLVLIASVPGHCLHFTYYKRSEKEEDCSANLPNLFLNNINMQNKENVDNNLNGSKF